MLKKTAPLSAVLAIALLMPVLMLRAGTTDTITALPAPPPGAPQPIGLEARPVAVTPIPEPSSVVLVTSALAWCFWRGRRVATARATQRQFPG
jgi:hypothetical protein